MHSIRELAGSKDSDLLNSVLSSFFNISEAPRAK
jgi:aspartyl aminopeptidase